MKKKQVLLLLPMILILSWCNLKQENILEKIDNTTWEVVDSKELENNDTNYYESKSGNFSLNFPKEWTLKENEYWFDTIIFTPKDDEINENVWISVQKLQKFLSVQEYYEETISQLKDTLIWFKEIKSEDINKWTLNWKKIEYEHKSDDKTLYSQQSFLISPENIVYSINYTATKNTFKNFIKWVELILNSFDVNK